MSDRHVIIGSGPVGRATADALHARDAEVVLASRSGRDGTTPVDAADPEALSRLVDGAVAVYNCVNPPSYLVWQQWWPPVAAGLLAAAERTGAVLVTTGNLYAYGPVPDGVMREGMPDAATTMKAQLRAAMTRDALDLHAAGRIRAVEVRGSDYVGAPMGDNAHVPRVVPRALQGRSVTVIGSAHQPHTWTDVRDMGRALALVATEESSWGRIWHAPSNPPRTQAEAVNDILASVGRDPVTVRALPARLLGVIAPFVPLLGELRETAYQFTAPYVMESSAITAAYGIDASPWEDVCRRTVGGSLQSLR